MISKKQSRFLASTLTAALVATAIAPTTGIAAEEAEKPFSDVELGTPYTEPITQLKDAGVMSGYPDGTFGIRTPLTRAHAAIMFANIRDLDTNVAAAPFADVKQDAYYTEAINAAYAAGVIGGHSEKRFAPNDHLTRGQMAVMMVQAYDLEQVTDIELPFSDLQENHWATPFVKTLYANGLFNGKSTESGTIAAVDEKVDRGDFAILLAATDSEYGHKLGAEDPTELVVKSVEAINTTVDINGTLAFTVNGKEEAASLEVLQDAGYEVVFKASADVFGVDKNTSSTGKVSSEKDKTFDYQVVIKKDGKVVAESARQTVEVLDYASVITAITEVNVHKDGLAIADGQLAMGDKDVVLTVNGTVMGNDETVPFENPTFSVDRPAILKVESDGKVIPHAKGEAVVTVKVGEVTETITLTVGDTRHVDVEKSIISEKEIEVAAGKTAKAVVDLKDQYGLAFDGTVTAKDAEDVNVLSEVKVTSVQVEGQIVAGKYELELTAVDEAAEGNVVVKAGDTELGQIHVTVKEPGAAVTYELTTDNTEFDRKTEAGREAKKLTLKAYDEAGLEAELKGSFIYESSNEEIIKVDENGEVTLVATEGGKTATVVAKKVSGAFKDQVAEIEFTVIDSTPTLNDVEFTSDIATQSTLTVDFNQLGSVTATSPKGDVKVAYRLVDSKDALEIVEADEEGKALDPEIVIGKVIFSPKVTIEKVNKEGIIEFDESVYDKKVTASFIDNEDTFKGQIKLFFEIEKQE